MEVYVDDMIIKSKKKVDHVADHRESFKSIQNHKMKLNQSTCSLRLTSGIFLRFLITQRGIETYLNQIKAIPGHY